MKSKAISGINSTEFKIEIVMLTTKSGEEEDEVALELFIVNGDT